LSFSRCERQSDCWQAFRRDLSLRRINTFLRDVLGFRAVGRIAGRHMQILLFVLRSFQDFAKKTSGSACALMSPAPREKSADSLTSTPLGNFL